MRRRTFVAATIAAVAIPMIVSGSWATGLSRVSITGPFGSPSQAYTVKGTLYFRIAGEKVDRSLNTYWNKTVYDPARQCPELIKRYARLLGFSGYNVPITGDNGNKLPSLGNGDAAASRFATASAKGFVYHVNGSATLPKPGSVISISGRSRADNVLRIDGGHVGILGHYTPPSTTAVAVSAKLFDQNMPIALWKDIRFHKKNGKWYGLWTNSGRDHDVVGWATPSS